MRNSRAKIQFLNFVSMFEMSICFETASTSPKASTSPPQLQPQTRPKRSDFETNNPKSEKPKVIHDLFWFSYTVVGVLLNLKKGTSVGISEPCWQFRESYSQFWCQSPLQSRAKKMCHFVCLKKCFKISSWEVNLLWNAHQVQLFLSGNMIKQVVC